MSEQEHQSLIRVLEKKREWLQKMLEVTLSFEKQLQNDEVEAFSKGLEQRQAMIATIDGFIKEERSILCEDSPEIIQLREQTRSLIRRILAADQKNAALAVEKINQYKTEIKKLNQNKKREKSYSDTYRANEAVYIDSKK